MAKIIPFPDRNKEVREVMRITFRLPPILDPNVGCKLAEKYNLNNLVRSFD